MITNFDTKETRTSSDCSGQYNYLIQFQKALFTKVIPMICLVTEMIDWKQKLRNQWVQIEIGHVQPCKPGKFLATGLLSLNTAVTLLCPLLCAVPYSLDTREFSRHCWKKGEIWQLPLFINSRMYGALSSFKGR